MAAREAYLPYVERAAEGRQRSRWALVVALVFREQAVDHGLGGGPVVGAKHAPVHHRLGGGVEHLVLELAPAVLGADEVPDQLDELHPVVRGGGRRPVVALGMGARLAREKARLG